MKPGQLTGLMRYIPNFVTTVVRAIANFLGWKVIAIKAQKQIPGGKAQEPTSVYAKKVVRMANENCSEKMPVDTYR